MFWGQAMAPWDWSTCIGAPFPWSYLFGILETWKWVHSLDTQWTVDFLFLFIIQRVKYDRVKKQWVHGWVCEWVKKQWVSMSMHERECEWHSWNIKMSTLLGCTLDFWHCVCLLYKELNIRVKKQWVCVYEYVRERECEFFLCEIWQGK